MKKALLDINTFAELIFARGISTVNCHIDSHAWRSRYRLDLQAHCQKRGVAHFSLNANDLTIENLIDNYYKSPLNSISSLNNSLSPYRRFKQLVESHDASLLVIYNAEKLSKDLQSVLARLAQAVDRDQINARLLLVFDCCDFHEVPGFNAYLKSPDLRLFNEDSLPQDVNHDTLSNRALFGGTAFVVLSGLAIVYLLSNPVTQIDVPEEASKQAVATEPNTDAHPKLSNLHAEPADKDLAKSTPESTSVDSELLDSSFDYSKQRDNQLKKAFAEIEKKYRKLNKVEKARAVTAGVAEKSQDITQSVQAGNNQIAETKLVKSTPVEVATQVAKAKMSDAMLEAVKAEDWAQINSLLEAGEHLNAVNASGETLLVMAGWLGNESLMHKAIDAGANIELADNDGNTPLYYAAVFGMNSVVRKLVSKNVLIDASNNVKKTALMAAVHNQHQSTANLLVDSGANLEKVDRSGWSALFYSVWNDDPILTAYLLGAGADLSKSDDNGNSVSDIAKYKQLKNVLALVQ